MKARQKAIEDLGCFGLKVYPYKGLPTKGLILLTTDKEAPRTTDLGRHISFYCNKCGEAISGIYESEVEKEQCGVYRHTQYCHNCGNRLDFGRYYTTREINGKPWGVDENENVKWEQD